MNKLRSLSFTLCCFFWSISAQVPVDYPCDLGQYVGQTVVFTNPLMVTGNYNISRTGELTLSSERLYSPTEVTLPASSEYEALVRQNRVDQLILKKAGNYDYRSADGSCRSGRWVTGLTGKIGYESGSYTITPVSQPRFTGGERPEAPASVGDCNLKIASFNLNYYMSTPYQWKTSNGAKNGDEFLRQKNKIIRALIGLNADIYALCEVGEGPSSIYDLTEGLNEILGEQRYTYVEDTDKEDTKYTKNAFIYDRKKLKPYGQIKYNTVISYLSKRKIAIAFDQIDSGERIIVSMNHFLSKSGGSGDDADQGDGQGPSNASRVLEATATVSFLNTLENTFKDKDILVVGDLNAYTCEDPIQILERGGLVNEHTRFAHADYSYVYQSQAGYLDHALSTPSLSRQITGVTVWHINADEPEYMGYKNATNYRADPYRCSDHDPVLTGVNLNSNPQDLEHTTSGEALYIHGDPSQGYVTLRAGHIERVDVFGINGQLITASANPSAGSYFVLETSHLKPGYYLIRVSGNGTIHTAKLVIG